MTWAISAIPGGWLLLSKSLDKHTPSPWAVIGCEMGCAKVVPQGVGQPLYPKGLGQSVPLTKSALLVSGVFAVQTVLAFTHAQGWSVQGDG